MKISPKWLKKGGRFFAVQLTVFSMVINTAYPALTAYALDAAAAEQAAEQVQPEEKDTPKEDVVKEEPAEEKVPKEEVTTLEPEAKITEEAAKTEDTSKEEPKEEDLGGKICLDDNDQVKDSSKDDWDVDQEKGIATTKNPVELGVKYKFPLEEKTSITFTCLPKDPERRSQLKIEQLKTSDLQLPEGVLPATEYAYDITTEMKDGDFEYDLTLPGDENLKKDDVQVVYVEEKEDLKDENKIKQVKEDDVKVDEEKDEIKAEGLDHFTVFVVVKPNENINTTSNGVTNEGNAWESDDQYVDFNNNSDFSEYGFPDLNIPADATIEGIEVSIEGYRTSATGSNRRNFTAAIWNKSNSNPDAYTNSKQATLGTSESIQVLGGPTDKWGKSWTATDFSDTDLKIKITATGSTSTSYHAYLDQVKVNVYYNTCGNGTKESDEECDGSDLGDLPANELSCNSSCKLTLNSSKITICHSTSSKSNPYNQENPNKSADVNGHDGHDGGVYPVNPWGDIIPPFWYLDDGPQQYPGKNWTTEGQAIWNNGCEIPVQNGSITITKDVVPDDSSVWDFSISGTGGPYNVNDLGDGESYTVNNLVPGSYNITEITDSNYTTAVICGGVGPFSQNAFLGTVTAGQDLSCTFTNTRKTAPIHINKFEDKNADGDADAGEGPLQDWTMEVYDNETCTGTPVATGQTGGDGIVTIGGLLVGETYWINEVVTSGWQVTTGNCRSYQISDTAINNKIGFGNVQLPGSISGMKWNDLNGNGTKDDNEPGLSGWSIGLRTDLTSHGAGSMITDANGEYTFTNVAPGNYYVCEYGWPSTIENWIQKYPNDGPQYDGLYCYQFTLNPGENKVGVDFGNKKETECGDGIKNDEEQCDYGSFNGESSCSNSCEWVSGCREEMMANGGFETPTVEHSAKWNIFDNSQVPGWTAEWYGGSSSYNDHKRPEPKIELHRGVNGWNPAEGNQYVELDTDWEGPDSSLNGEPSSISLSQEIPTIPGNKYELTWKYSPRPNHNNNQLEVMVGGGSVFDSGNLTGGSNTNWQTETYSFVADAELTEIRFVETGNPDSLGMFLDDVSVECLGTEKSQYKCDATVYTANNSEDISWLDIGNGSVNYLDDLDFGSSASADDPFEDHTYYISRYGTSLLKYYDHSDAASYDVGPTGIASSFFTKLAFNTYGELYGLTDDHKLYQLDTANGQATLLGTVSGIGTGGDIVIDENNILYLIGTDGKLYTVNIGTQEKTLVKATGLNTVTGLAYVGGKFYVSTAKNSYSESDIYEMDKNGENIIKLNESAQPIVNDLSSCLPGAKPICGDGKKNGEEQCDGTDGVAEGENFCSQSCQLVPIYHGGATCSQGKVPGDMMYSGQVSSTDPIGQIIGLDSNKEYLFRASGSFNPTSASGYLSDAGYTWINNVLSAQYGIQGTPPDFGAHALLADLGLGVGVVDWGTASESHVYDFSYTTTTDPVQFVIGDRYADWFNTSWQNQSGMGDNQGSLNLEIYECQAPKTTVKVCKTDQNGNPLSGWKVGLSQPTGFDEEIPVGSADGISTSLEGGAYVVYAFGTYRYGNSAMIADAGYSYRPAGIPYGTDGWVSGDDLLSVPGALELKLSGGNISESNIDWGNFNSSHQYSHYLTGFEGDLKMSIWDDNYSDNLNNGNFRASIDRQMFASGYTGQDGCNTFTNVPYGDYHVFEIPQKDWVYQETKVGNDVVLNYPATVSVGEKVPEVTLVNKRLANGIIRIVKDVSPDDNETKFDYTLTGPNDYSAQDKVWEGNPSAEERLYAGEYTLSETDLSEYKESISCTNGQTSLNNSITFSLQDDEDVTCTLLNVKANPEIAVDKQGPQFVKKGEPVVYNYYVTNPGDVPLSNVSVSDDKCSVVTHEGGDSNNNDLLDLDETWQFSCTTTPVWSFNTELENTATAEGYFDQTKVEASDKFKLYSFILRKDVKLAGGGAYRDSNTRFDVEVKNGDNVIGNVQISESNPAKMWVAEGAYDFCEINLPSGYSPHYPNGCLTFKTGTYPDWTEINYLNPVTIHAAKIVCQEEKDLPNRGNGGPDITATTADDFVANSEGRCWFEQGWEFEYGHKGAGYPGDDYIGYGGGSYTSTGLTDSNGKVEVKINNLAPFNGRIEMREVLKEGYLPFTYATEGNKNTNDVSAEFYCGSDVMNYDNWEWINDPEYGQDYYCVAFNTKTPSEESCLTFEACVDGGDWVTVSNGQLSMVHGQADPIGKHNSCPVELKNVIKINDVAHPVSYDGSYKIDGNSNLPVDITQMDSVAKLDGRGPVSQDGNTAFIDDIEPGGADAYKLEICSGEGNVQLGSIHGYKWNDENGNGDQDGDEKKLAGWEIFLDENDNQKWDAGEEKTTTSSDSDPQHFGWYWFENLPEGEYSVCEVLKADEGWKQTFPGDQEEAKCHTVNLPDSNPAQYKVMENMVDGPVYNFGNKRRSCSLHLQKFTPDWTSGPKKVGDKVFYQLVIKALDNFAKNVVVTDLPPETFGYVGGSWTANSNFRGPLSIGEPTYHSPGDWDIGDMEEGEEITLTYEAQIGDGTENGVYPDLAWAKGTAPDGNNLLALSEDSGFAVGGGIVNDNFVGTQIEVGGDNSTTTVSVRAHKDEIIEEEEIEKEVKVLGDSTSILPATGSSNFWLILALGMLVCGLGLVFAGNVPAGKLKKLKKQFWFLLALAFVWTIFSQGALAASPISVRVSKPDAKVKDYFHLDYVALDLSGREVSIECLKKGPSDSDFVQFETKTLPDGGDSDFCNVDGTVLESSGNYEFKVTATAGADIAESAVVSTSYDSVGPKKPQYIEKDEKSSCRNKITFKTANDGQTTYVEVYRSHHSRTFKVGDETKIQTITIGPNQKYSFDDDLKPTGCGDNYFYAVRAFDDAGNASAPRVEELEEIIEKEKIVEVEVPIEGQTEGALASGLENVQNQSGNVSEQETSENKESVVTEGEGAQTSPENQTESTEVLGQQSEKGAIGEAFSKFWKPSLAALVAIAGVSYVIYQRKKSSDMIK